VFDHCGCCCIIIINSSNTLISVSHSRNLWKVTDVDYTDIPESQPELFPLTQYGQTQPVPLSPTKEVDVDRCNCGIPSIHVHKGQYGDLSCCGGPDCCPDEKDRESV
jgi:hypothetical protein